jgi:glutathione peroxidase
MMRSLLLAALLVSAAAGVVGLSSLSAADAPAKQETKVADALNFSMKDIDGKDVALATYQGKVILMVNVASKCGNTPQYAGLEKVYNTYKDKGFVILGFPANNFGAQEPGTDAQIKEFCTSKYSVTFPMFAKISVKGDDIAPLYKHLIAVDTKPQPKGNITWNFEKFLIGKDGGVVARFAPKTGPEDKTVVAAIEGALAK